MTQDEIRSILKEVLPVEETRETVLLARLVVNELILLRDALKRQTSAYAQVVAREQERYDTRVLFQIGNYQWVRIS